MENKATFKRCGYSGKYKIYTWEYRGHEYTTYVNKAQGNAVGDEPYKQHRKEQEKIDNAIAFHEAHKDDDVEKSRKETNTYLDNMISFWDEE